MNNFSRKSDDTLVLCTLSSHCWEQWTPYLRFHLPRAYTYMALPTHSAPAYREQPSNFCIKHFQVALFQETSQTLVIMQPIKTLLLTSLTGCVGIEAAVIAAREVVYSTATDVITFSRQNGPIETLTVSNVEAFTRQPVTIYSLGLTTATVSGSLQTLTVSSIKSSSGFNTTTKRCTRSHSSAGSTATRSGILPIAPAKPHLSYPPLRFTAPGHSYPSGAPSASHASRASLEATATQRGPVHSPHIFPIPLSFSRFTSVRSAMPFVYGSHTLGTIPAETVFGSRLVPAATGA